MGKLSRIVRAALPFLLAGACSRADAVVAPPGPEMTLVGAPQASSFPVETEFTGVTPAIVWVTTVAQAWFGEIQHANAAAQTQGWGNAGTQSLTLDIFEGATHLHRTQPSVAAFSTFLPGIWWLSDTVTVNISVSCGLSSTASVSASSALKVLPVGGVQAFTLFEQQRTGAGNGYMNACPPPPGCDDLMTDEVEECGDEGANAGTVYSPGGSHPTETPGVEHGGSTTSVWVCDVIDWFVSSDGGQTWQYENTELKACWLEPR